MVCDEGQVFEVKRTFDQSTIAATRKVFVDETIIGRNTVLK